MSFSKEQKAELLLQPPKASCCKSAFIQGALSGRGRADGSVVSLSVDSKEHADFVCSLVEELYSKKANVFTSPNGGRRRILSFESNSAVKYLADIDKKVPFKEKCINCRANFLRGLFLCCGRVSDPQKQYSLEFSVAEDRTEYVCEELSKIDITPRISKKPREVVVYIKRSGHIEDFFAALGMNSTAFAFMNEKINSELRNNVNRITNCTTNNIDKAVSASVRQISLIRELIDKGLISALPEELENTARLRLLHEDMSLSQLSAITSPRISKPGLSHRLKKITQLAEELLADKQ